MTDLVEGRIGPNAVLQLIEAVDAQMGRAMTEKVFNIGGCGHYLAHPPKTMVDEGEVASLNHALFQVLDLKRAQALAQDAGRRTADYVIANRIPRIVRILLSLMPPKIASAMLLRSIAKHAWTFVGSGELRINRGAIEVADNPIAMPGCPWHQAVFQRMFERLVSNQCLIQETTCCARGAPVCRFELSLYSGKSLV